MMDELLTTSQAAMQAGVPFYTLRYHLHAGHIPEPARFNGARVFTPEQVDRLKAYFASRELAEAARNGTLAEVGQ